MSNSVDTSQDNNLSPLGNGQDDRNPGKPIREIESQEFSEDNHFKVDYLDTPVKSANDKKDYRTIKLPNGLTALLISDVRSLIPDNQIDNNKGSNDIEKKTDEEENESEAKETEEVGSCEVAGSPNSEDASTAENHHPRKEEKMAACSLCVGVGSFSDPPEIPGLAHFLEHMVFMGSEKYPQENDYQAFIKKHGGYSNASTDCEETTFFFQIQENHLLGALDRLAQFFISPLMKQDAITREREAVDSEFQQSVTYDYRRKNEVFCSLVEPGHPATKFGVGNLITLRDNVEDDKLYEELHKFRQRHYSAHRMTLAIQARMPLDMLEQYVKDCFSAVPNNGLSPDDFTLFEGTKSFDTPAFNRIYKIKPVQDSCKIQLTWTLPSVHHLYKSKPGQIGWIIGHEGTGSLTDYLRKKMWCLDVCCGIGPRGLKHSSMYALFELRLTLTEDGHKHLKEVLDAVFSYISLVRKSGPQKRIYDEIRQISETSFRFVDEFSPLCHVWSLSQDMHFYPPSDYITGSELYFEYNPSEIKACMDALTPDRANIILLDKKFDDTEFEKITPWYKTKYTDIEIPQNWIEDWKNIEPFSDFHLPEPNSFITDDFNLVSLPDDLPEYPTKIHSDSMSEIWYKPDSKFKIPEACMSYYFKSPLAMTTLQNRVLMNLLTRILKHFLAGKLYPAEIAGLHYCVYSSDKGIVLSVGGFNQKLLLLLDIIMKCIADCSKLVTEDLFNVMKAEILKEYYNEFIEPHCLASDVRQSISKLVHWSSVDEHAALSDVEFHEIQSFAKQFFSRIYMQCLVQGNITKEDVIKNWHNCVEILKCKPALPNTLQQSRINQIPLGAQYCRVKNFNETDVNSVVTNYYQSGMGNIKTGVIMELLMMLMDEPIFSQLRTQEQLGYAVDCYTQDITGIFSYTVTVSHQADKFSTEHIDERIEAFLKSFLEILKKMPEKELDTVKIALVKLNQCVALNLYQDFYRNWDEIRRGDYMFDRRDKEIDAINETNIKELTKWMEDHVLGGNNLRKLSVQIVGQPQPKDEIANECSGKDEFVKKSEESTKADETSDNPPVAESHNSIPKHLNDVKYSLEYVAEMPNETEAKTSKNYITDIGAFKKTLYVYPVNHTTTT